LRILYDHQVFSLQDVGGASRYHYELLRYLSTVPGVYANLFLGLYRTIYPFRDLRNNGVKVSGLPAPLGPGTFRYAANEALETGASLLSGKFDIYHPTYFRRMPSVRASKVVTTLHDCTYEQFPQLFNDADSVIRYRHALFMKSDLIICISDASRRALLQFHPVDEAKTRVIHHGLDKLPRSAKAADVLRTRMRRRFLLYVGARNAHKNFPSFLEAFRASRLPGAFDLLCLGGGPFTESELDLLQKLKLQDCVQCLPVVSDDLVGEAYAAAALFVYPSLSEGFGMPPLEAMAAGCPVAASKVTAIPEVCRDAPFYFDPHDPASMASTLCRAVNDSDARSVAVTRGQDVAARYSWEKCGAETLAVYRTLF
jgi:glycosyltransferase involved in cell wall biosynthesis